MFPSSVNTATVRIWCCRQVFFFFWLRFQRLNHLHNLKECSKVTIKLCASVCGLTLAYVASRTHLKQEAFFFLGAESNTWVLMRPDLLFLFCFFCFLITGSSLPYCWHLQFSTVSRRWSASNHSGKGYLLLCLVFCMKCTEEKWAQTTKKINNG